MAMKDQNKIHEELQNSLNFRNFNCHATQDYLHLVCFAKTLDKTDIFVQFGSETSSLGLKKQRILMKTLRSTREAVTEGLG
jgi:hypothetical protein